MLTVKKLLKVAAAIAVGIAAALWLNHVMPKTASEPISLSSMPPTEEVASTTTADIIDALFAGDQSAQMALAAPVLQDIEQGISADIFETGSARYDGEWAVGSYQLAVLGLGQLVQAHPQLVSAYLPAMERSVERLITPEMNQFGIQAWDEDRLARLHSDSLQDHNGHAYLGYTNLALSMLRLHNPNNQFVNLNDRLTASLLKGLITEPYGLLETYPNEVYPADIAAVIGSIALHDKATGESHQRELAKLVQYFCDQFLDPATGLVFQSVDVATGQPIDRPRASGTALSAYYLSFVDNVVTAHIFQPVASSQILRLPVGLAIKEYPVGETGDGDIDSGLLVLGASPSATVFAIGGAKITNDKSLYRELYETILSFSRLPPSQGEFSKVAADNLLETPLGHSILLAMLTADS
ncbi:MAG: hypothetical protein AAFP09_16710 [Cyanobacteria bacterium J06607_10]